VVIAVVLYRMMGPNPLNITTSNAVRVTSEPGLEWQPAVSPDGSQVAFVAYRGGRQSVVIKGTRNIAGGGELTPTQGLDGAADWFPTWSPDGGMVRFWYCPGEAEACSWKEVARLGGSVRSMDLPRNGRNCSWSPSDSRWVCAASRDSVVTYSISDSVVSSVLVHPEAHWGGPHSPVWSPDERWIAYVLSNSAWRSSFNVDVSSIWVVKAQGGEPLRVTGDDHMDTSPVWLDDNHLLFVSNRDGMREVYVAELGPTGPRGEPRKVPGVTDAHWISYSIAGRKLAFAKATVRQNIWSYPTGLGLQSISDGRTVTSGNAAIESHDISPDGEWIVYDSDLRGNQDIYKMAVEGG
jgi:Tol biopolymer transport system component